MASHSVSLQSVHWQAFWWNSWSIGPWFAQGMDYSIPNSSEVLALAWTTYCTILYLLSPLELCSTFTEHLPLLHCSSFFGCPSKVGPPKRGSSEQEPTVPGIPAAARPKHLAAAGQQGATSQGKFHAGLPKSPATGAAKNSRYSLEILILYDITWLVVLMVRICSNALAVLVTSSRKHNPWFGMFWQNDNPSRNGVSWGWKSCCSNGGINSSWPWPKGCFMLPPCSATCFF